MAFDVKAFENRLENGSHIDWRLEYSLVNNIRTILETIFEKYFEFKHNLFETVVSIKF